MKKNFIAYFVAFIPNKIGVNYIFTTLLIALTLTFLGANIAVGDVIGIRGK
jgi:hypothetical protein